MLAEMAIEIDATRLLAWEAAWKIDRGEDATREACLAQHYAANMALKVTDNAVQVLGGHGYIRDHLVELFLRNGRGFAVFEGLAMVVSRASTRQLTTNARYAMIDFELSPGHRELAADDPHDGRADDAADLARVRRARARGADPSGTR